MRACKVRTRSGHGAGAPHNATAAAPKDGRCLLCDARYTEKYSSYSKGCGRCAAGMISAERL